MYEVVCEFFQEADAMNYISDQEEDNKDISLCVTKDMFSGKWQVVRVD